MTWLCKPLLSAVALALLAGCAASVQPAQPAPQPLTQPMLSAADIRAAEQHAYWAGYAAGRRYQKQQDTQTALDQGTQSSPTPAAAPPAPAPPTSAPPTTAAVTAAPPAAVPVQPIPPPPDSYVPKGPAQPVATPMN
jgi:hypothetical protein